MPLFCALCVWDVGLEARRSPLTTVSTVVEACVEGGAQLHGNASIVALRDAENPCVADSAHIMAHKPRELCISRDDSVRM